MYTSKASQIFRILKKIRPNSQFSTGDTYESISWLDTEQAKPTKEEFDKAVKDYEADQYQRDRLIEYPSIQECIHAILDDDLDALQAKRNAVKTKYPKPE